MKILLTGASGFIGGHLASALVQSGHEVVAAVRDPDRTQRRFPAVRALRMDFNHLPEVEDWEPHLRDVACVINCAGLLTRRHGESLEAVNEKGPISLFEACAKYNVRRVIQISIVSIGAGSVFAATKRRADDYLQATELDWTILRPSIVYARDSYGGTAMLRGLAACPVVTPLPGKGEQKFQPIHVDDLCRTVLKALDGNAMVGKILEPCGPDELTIADMVAGYRSWLGLAPQRVMSVPMLLVRLAAKIGDRIGSGPVTSNSLTQLKEGNVADFAAFKRDVDITPMRFVHAMAAEPAGSGDLWHARFYLLRPLLFLALVVFWLASGAVGVIIPAKDTAPYLFDIGLSEAVATLLRKGLAMAEIGIALLILSRETPRWSFVVQLAAVFIHTLLVGLAEPDMWADMAGPLARNLPLLGLIFVHRVLEEER